jgi:hypothetical protein
MVEDEEFRAGAALEGTEGTYAMKYRVALVSCVKSKQSAAARASELYTSDLFRKMREYARANSDAWYILSAEHGLLDPNQVIEPYERTLNTMGKADRDTWAKKVQQRLLEVIPPNSQVIILAGERYREGIVPFLEEHAFQVIVPMEGLSFGRQLQWLNAEHVRSDAPSFPNP